MKENKKQFQQRMAAVDFAYWLMQNCELIRDSDSKNILWRFEGEDYTLDKLYSFHKVM